MVTSCHRDTLVFTPQADSLTVRIVARAYSTSVWRLQERQFLAKTWKLAEEYPLQYNRAFVFTFNKTLDCYFKELCSHIVLRGIHYIVEIYI